MTGAAVTRLAGRVVLSVLAAAVAVLIATVGVSAAYASIDEARPGVGLELVPVAGLDGVEQAPGAVIERVLTLRSSGTAGYRAIDFGSTTPGRVPGLRLQVVGCDTGWRLAPAGPVCAGRKSILMAGDVGATATLTSAAALRPGGTDSLLVRLTLPSRTGVAARVTYTAVGR